MTKKLLLAAAAAGAMAFAGAASAGSLSNTSQISGVTLAQTAEPTKFGAYTVASEAKDPTVTGGASDVTTAIGGVLIDYRLTSKSTVAQNVVTEYEVIFSAEGAGSFIGASAVQSYVGVLNASGAVIPSVDHAAEGIQVTQLGILANGTVSAIVKVTGKVGGTEVGGFRLTSGLQATSEADIKVAAATNVIASGIRIELDKAAATTVVQFKQALKAYTATATNVLAALPDFKTFKVSTTAPAAPVVAGTVTSAAFSTALNDAGTYAGGKFRRDLTVGAASDVDTLAKIVGTTAATVTGTNLNKLSPTLAGVATPTGADLTANVAKFTLPAGTATGALTLTPAAAADRVPLEAGTYSVAILPTYVNGFTSPTTATTVNVLNVALDGTNFTAPWFTLDNPNNMAFLRLANNGTAPTGPVFVELKAHNGTTPPTTARVQVADFIAPNGVFQITGPDLLARFGSNAQNGDLAVTIQGDGNVISGKVRIRNSTGALSEQTLGTITGN